MKYSTKRQPNRREALQEGLGYYTNPKSMGCVTLGNNCASIGSEKLIQYCIPNPVTGKGCIDEKGEISYKMVVRDRPCNVQCYSNKFIEQDDIYLENPLMDSLKVVSGAGCNKVISGDFGLDYTDYFIGDFISLDEKGKNINKYELKSCIPDNYYGYSQTIYTCQSQDNGGIEGCRYLCGKDPNVLKLNGIFDAKITEDLLKYYPFEFDVNGNKRYICNNINDIDQIQILNFTEKIPEDFVYPDICYKHTPVLNYSGNLWPVNDSKNNLILKEKKFNNEQIYITLTGDDIDNFKTLYSGDSKIFTENYSISTHPNSYVKILIGNEIALLDKVIEPEIDISSGLDQESLKKGIYYLSFVITDITDELLIDAINGTVGPNPSWELGVDKDKSGNYDVISVSGKPIIMKKEDYKINIDKSGFTNTIYLPIDINSLYKKLPIKDNEIISLSITENKLIISFSASTEDVRKLYDNFFGFTGSSSEELTGKIFYLETKNIYIWASESTVNKLETTSSDVIIDKTIFNIETVLSNTNLNYSLGQDNLSDSGFIIENLYMYKFESSKSDEAVSFPLNSNFTNFFLEEKKGPGRHIKYVEINFFNSFLTSEVINTDSIPFPKLDPDNTLSTINYATVLNNFDRLQEITDKDNYYVLPSGNPWKNSTKTAVNFTKPTDTNSNYDYISTGLGDYKYWKHQTEINSWKGYENEDLSGTSVDLTINDDGFIYDSNQYKQTNKPLLKKCYYVFGNYDGKIGYYYPLKLINNSGNIKFEEFVNTNISFDVIGDNLIYDSYFDPYKENNSFDIEYLDFNLKATSCSIYLNIATNQKLQTDSDSIGFLRNINIANGGQDFSKDYPILEILPYSIQIGGKFHLEIKNKLVNVKNIKIIRRGSDYYNSITTGELSENNFELQLKNYMKIIELQQQNFSNLTLEDSINFTVIPEKSLTKIADFRIFKSPYVIKEDGEYDFVCYNNQGAPKDVGTVINVPTNQSLYVNKLCNNFNTISGSSCGILGIENTDTVTGEKSVRPCVQNRVDNTGVFVEDCIPVTQRDQYHTLNDYLTDGIRKVPLISTEKFGDKEDDDINIFNNFFTRELEANKTYDLNEELYTNKATEKFYLSLINENTQELNDPAGWELIDLYQSMVTSLPGQNYFYPYYLNSINYPFYQNIIKYKEKKEVISPDFRCIFKSDSKGINNINFMNDAVTYYYGHQYSEPSSLLNLIPYFTTSEGEPPSSFFAYNPAVSVYKSSTFPVFPSFYALSILKNFSVVNTPISFTTLNGNKNIINVSGNVADTISTGRTFLGINNTLRFSVTGSSTIDILSSETIDKLFLTNNQGKNKIYDNRFRINVNQENTKNIFVFQSRLYDNTINEQGNDIVAGDFIGIGIEYFMDFFYKFNISPFNTKDGKITPPSTHDPFPISQDEGINYNPSSVDELKINNLNFSVYFSRSYKENTLDKQITVNNFEKSELNDKIKDQDILLIFISDYQLSQDVNEIFYEVDSTDSVNYENLEQINEQINSFESGIFKPELTRVTNVTSVSFTLTRNIQNTTRKQLPRLFSNGDISQLVRVVNLGNGDEILKQYFKITNVNKEGDQDTDSLVPNSPYIEFEFKVDSISQDQLEKYKDSDNFYSSYDIDKTRSGFLPKTIPIKYIKSEYQSPYQKINDTEENLNLCLYNSSNNNNLGNKFFSMITEIRISDVEISVKDSDSSEEKKRNQRYYFIKEFRNQQFFDVPQSELTFNIGDVIDFYDVINDNVGNKFSKIEKKITNFKFKIVDTNVILYDNIKEPEQAELTPIKNLYDYQCLLVGGNDSDFKIPETLFFFGNPTTRDDSLNKSRLYIDLMEPVETFQNSSPITDIPFDPTIKRLDFNYYNPTVNTIKNTTYNSIGVLDLGYQTVTYATNYNGVNKITYTESNFKDNKITTKHRFVLPHNVIYENTTVIPNINSLRGELILGTLANIVPGKLNTLVSINKGSGPGTGPARIGFIKIFEVSIDYTNFFQLQDIYSSITNNLQSFEVTPMNGVNSIYATTLLKMGCLPGLRLSETRITSVKDETNYIDINLNVIGKPLGSGFLIDFSNDPLNQIGNYEHYGKLLNFTFTDSLNLTTINEGDIFQSNSGLQFIITNQIPVKYKFVSSEQSTIIIKNYEKDSAIFNKDDIVSLKNKNLRKYFRNTSGSKSKFDPKTFQVIPRTIFPEDDFIDFNPNFPIYYEKEEIVHQKDYYPTGLYKALEDNYGVSPTLSNSSLWEYQIFTSRMQTEETNNFYTFVSNEIKKGIELNDLIDDVRKLNNQNLPLQIKPYYDQKNKKIQKGFCPRGCTKPVPNSNLLTDSFVDQLPEYFGNIKNNFETPIIISEKTIPYQVLSLGHVPIDFNPANIYSTQYLNDSKATTELISQYFYFVDLKDGTSIYNRENCSGNFQYRDINNNLIDSGVSRFIFSNSAIFQFVPCDIDSQDYIKLGTSTLNGVSIINFDENINGLYTNIFGSRNMTLENGLSVPMISENDTTYTGVCGTFKSSYSLSWPTPNDLPGGYQEGSIIDLTSSSGDDVSIKINSLGLNTNQFVEVSNGGNSYEFGDLWHINNDGTSGNPVSYGYVTPVKNSLQNSSFVSLKKYKSVPKELTNDFTLTVESKNGSDLEINKKHPELTFLDFEILNQTSKKIAPGNYSDKTGSFKFYLEVATNSGTCGYPLQPYESLVELYTSNGDKFNPSPGTSIYYPTYDISKNIKVKAMANFGFDYLSRVKYGDIEFTNSENGNKNPTLFFDQFNNETFVNNYYLTDEFVIDSNTNRLNKNVLDVITLNYNYGTSFSMVASPYSKPIREKNSELIRENNFTNIGSVISESTVNYINYPLNDIVGTSIRVSIDEFLEFNQIYNPQKKKVRGYTNLQIHIRETRQNRSNEYIDENDRCSIYFKPSPNVTKIFNPGDTLELLVKENVFLYGQDRKIKGNRFDGTFVSNATLDLSGLTTFSAGNNLTYHFTQYDTSNSGHPVVFSTSDTDFEDNIIKDTKKEITGNIYSFVNYDLDNEDVTFTDYTNLKKFNSAELRSVYFTLETPFDPTLSFPDIYYGFNTEDGYRNGGKIEFIYH